MKKRDVSHTVSGAFVFLLLGLFAVFSTVTVLLGARAYRNISASTGVNSAQRISSSYLRSMLRADDEAGAVYTEKTDGIETLVMKNVYDGEEYLTRIYVYDGYLREWFTEADMPFEPENGETVCPAEEMTAAEEDGLIRIRVKTDGVFHEIRCAQRSAGTEGGAE